MHNTGGVNANIAKVLDPTNHDIDRDKMTYMAVKTQSTMRCKFHIGSKIEHFEGFEKPERRL